MKTKLTIVYVAFFTLIGFAIWVTKSATPLWALLLTNAVPKFLAEEAEKDKVSTNDDK